VIAKAGVPALSRRATLGGALTLAVAPVLGCTLSPDPDEPRPGDPDASNPAGDLDATAARAVTAALDAVIAHRAWLEAVTVAYPGVGARALRVVAMHQAHQAYLTGLLGTSEAAVPSPAPVPARRGEVGKAVVASLDRHEATLTELAVATREPRLARVLASLGAATAQVGTATGWVLTGRESSLPTEPELTTELEQAALQQVLQREHASLWWYGVLGARTSASRERELFEAVAEGYRAHRQQRDQLDACLRSLEVEPVAADPAYPLTWPTRTARQRALAVSTIEHDAAAAYSWLVAQIGVVDEAAPKASVRRWAVTALRNAAIRELVGQGTPENFPGADEIADR
jgi:Domain of unknown function (DUF4439)